MCFQHPCYGEGCYPCQLMHKGLKSLVNLCFRKDSMGHVQSKRKKEKKRKKMSDIVRSFTAEPADNIHQVEGHRIYRENVSTDQFSNSSGYFSNESSPPSSGNDVNWYANEVVSHDSEDNVKNVRDGEKGDKEGFRLFPIETCQDYKSMTIEDHPALTKLQNEQNARLETMEQRIAKIRLNAQQAYDRKKFAHLFRARKEDSRTEKLLQEARDMLQKNIEEQTFDKASLNNNEYSGEIIPVHIIDNEPERETGNCHSNERYLQLAPFESLKLSKFLFSKSFILHVLFPLQITKK